MPYVRSISFLVAVIALRKLQFFYIFSVLGQKISTLWTKARAEVEFVDSNLVGGQAQITNLS